MFCYYNLSIYIYISETDNSLHGVGGYIIRCLVNYSHTMDSKEEDIKNGERNPSPESRYITLYERNTDRSRKTSRRHTRPMNLNILKVHSYSADNNTIPNVPTIKIEKDGDEEDLLNDDNLWHYTEPDAACKVRSANMVSIQEVMHDSESAEVGSTTRTGPISTDKGHTETHIENTDATRKSVPVFSSGPVSSKTKQVILAEDVLNTPHTGQAEVSNITMMTVQEYIQNDLDATVAGLEHPICNGGLEPLQEEFLESADTVGLFLHSSDRGA